MKPVRAKNANWKVRPRSRAARPKRRALKIPPILLEGDEPPLAVAVDPGLRFTIPPPTLPQAVIPPTPTIPILPQAAAPEPAPVKVIPRVETDRTQTPETFQSNSGKPQPAKVAEIPAVLAPKAPTTGTELPEAYGTKRLVLTPRDSNWFYAHWDLTREQLEQYNQLSRDGHLVLRIYQESKPGEPASEIQVHPESRNWFVRALEGGTRHSAELGYYPQEGGNWVCISTSAPAMAPRSGLSQDLGMEFGSVTADLPFNLLVRLARNAIGGSVPLMEMVQRLRASGAKGLPTPGAVSAGRWTPEQERALAELVQYDESRRVWIGSIEITELIQGQFRKELAQAVRIGELESWSGAMPGISSLAGITGEERERGFWLNVNAELVIYGATEPDAAVSIGGRPIQLRPDGTFSFRFALPDGHYELPAVATSADGTETRSAALHFSRETEYRGEVALHPQAPELKPPLVENVA